MQQYRKNLGKVSLTAEGAWNLNNNYDILSIVYDEHTQHGFISRKAVPQGVDLYNKEYWMPLNVSGYADNNVIILSKKTSEASIQSYTLEEAIASIKSVGRRPGAILGFYNENADRLDIGGCWELWQFNDANIYNWDNVDSWQNLYYNYNKFMGWFKDENFLNKYAPFPEIGCYAFVGSEFNEATVYRCDNKYVWKNTTQHAWDYVKVVVDGNVTVGENGNWFNNGEDTGIPASVKGENGKTPVFREKDNTIQYSFDNINWITISDKVSAWFRWNATIGDTQANNVGRIQISRDNVTWTNLSGDIINNLHISRYIGADETLPTNGIAEGTIYAKGPTYADEDTSHANPIYRLWVYAWKGNTLAWQDNGEFQSIAAGIVQETGNSETTVMSQKAVTEELFELDSKIDLLKGKRLVPKMGVVWDYEGNQMTLAAPTFGASMLIDIHSLFVDSEGYSYISNGNITGYGSAFPALVMFDNKLNLLGFLESLKQKNKLDLSELVEGTRFVGLNVTNENATIDKLYGEALPRAIYDSIQDNSNQLKSEIELNSVYESKMKSWGYHADFNSGYINPKNDTYDGMIIRALNFGKEFVCSYKVSGIIPLALVACYSDIPKPGNNSDIYIGTGTCSPYGDITLLEGTKYFVVDINVTDYNFDDGLISIKLKIANSSVTETKLDYNLKTKLNSIYSPKMQSSGCQVDFNSGYVNKTNDTYDGTIIRAIDIEGDIKLNYKVSGINPLSLVACYSDMPQLGDNSSIYLGNGTCSSDGTITLLDGTKYFIIDIRKSDSDFANGTLSVRLKIDSPSIDSSSIRVVAWGDSLTQGAGSDKHRHQSNFISALKNKGYSTDLSANSVITYPIMIQKLLGEKYDVLNCGVGGENLNTIASRVGANVAFPKSDFTLPSDDSAVQIGNFNSGLGSAWGVDIFPLLQGDGNSVNPCYVQGVECELKWTGTSNSDINGTYTLKRKHIGERSMSISTNTAIIFSGSKLCSNTKLAVVWCWANGGYNNNTTELIEKLDKIIAHLGTDKYVIVGIHTGDVTFAKNQESVLASKYGNKFFNWREYVSSHALYDWGITPTTNNDLTDEQIKGGVISDAAAMAEGSLPMSLWRKYIGDDLGSTSNDKVHLTAVGYGILGFKIVERFKILGYV